MVPVTHCAQQQWEKNHRLLLQRMWATCLGKGMAANDFIYMKFSWWVPLSEPP